MVADGNSPDPDDIGATAVILGILNGAALRDRLMPLSHSCDLDPFRNPGKRRIDAANERRLQDKLDALCGEGTGLFGPFDNLRDYFNCRTEREAAVNDMRDAINASSAEDPLWIIEAGEPDVIGYALGAASAPKREFLYVVSHHPVDDNSGDFFVGAEFGVRGNRAPDRRPECGATDIDGCVGLGRDARGQGDRVDLETAGLRRAGRGGEVPAREVRLLRCGDGVLVDHGWGGWGGEAVYAGGAAGDVAGRMNDE